MNFRPYLGFLIVVLGFFMGSIAIRRILDDGNIAADVMWVVGGLASCLGFLVFPPPNVRPNEKRATGEHRVAVVVGCAFGVVAALIGADCVLRDPSYVPGWALIGMGTVIALVMFFASEGISFRHKKLGEDR
ncbi:hypothetical protein E3O25_12360 [Cryobacterium sp. TMT1-3]|uniref:hypothetical protein n=1 Tax=Cryobacterium sp. TMT1-3 TaxID=1259237 RepID=UPI0010695038|nr:hypothetical protein [Cryobacterium sp. TMT1-3]TFC25412.1 hypothetical protein E3O25_12360 [Cryobacterium sp. TMT1-3]